MTHRRHEKIERIPESGCWIWSGATNAKGYGVCGDGLVHRWMYRQTRGEIPDGLYVLHKCDIRPCCNPEHLYVGTQKDNVRDMDERGRANRIGQKPGEDHPLAKLTKEQVEQMRHKHLVEGITQKRLAADYGICNQQVSRIITGKRWAQPEPVDVSQFSCQAEAEARGFA